MTPYAALLDRIRRDPAAPLLTYRDLRTSERMELSAASLGNAVAKTAGLIRDELDVEPGAVIGVHLPLLWQRWVWLGACAATGAVFAPGLTAERCDILVVDRDRLGLADRSRGDVMVSLAPFGMPDGGDIPAGITEAAVAMRGHPDVFVPREQPVGSSPLLLSDRLLTQEDVMARAAAELARRGVGSGRRFALLGPDPHADVLALAGPLIGDSAVLVVAHPEAGDLAGILREERVSLEEHE